MKSNEFSENALWNKSTFSPENVRLAELQRSVRGKKKEKQKGTKRIPHRWNKITGHFWRGEPKAGSWKPLWVHPDPDGGGSSQINVVSLGHVSEISAGFSVSLQKHAARSLDWAPQHLSEVVNNRCLKPDSCFWSLKPMTDHLTRAAVG